MLASTNLWRHVNLPIAVSLWAHPWLTAVHITCYLWCHETWVYISSLPYFVYSHAHASLCWAASTHKSECAHCLEEGTDTGTRSTSAPPVDGEWESASQWTILKQLFWRAFEEIFRHTHTNAPASTSRAKTGRSGSIKWFRRTQSILL